MYVALTFDLDEFSSSRWVVKGCSLTLGKSLLHLIEEYDDAPVSTSRSRSGAAVGQEHSQN